MPQNAKDIRIDENRLKVFVYGASGAGKSTFASSFPKPYFFDFDEGMMSLRGKDIEYDVYTDTSFTTATAYDAYKRKIEELTQLYTKGEGPYQTVVIDSFTMLQTCVINEIKKNNGTLGKLTTQMEWGMIIEEVMKGLDIIFSLPVNVVVTAHETTEKNELTGAIVTAPLIYGKKNPGKVTLRFDEYYRATTKTVSKKPVYQMHLAGSYDYTAKSRLNSEGVLADVEESLTYGKLMEKLGEVKKNNEGDQNTQATN